MTKSDWQDFEISLIETYRKNPTVENAENIMQHFSDQVKNNPDEISPELQAWVNEKLVEGLGKKQKDNPIGKALGLVRKKGEQPSKEPEHAIAHMKIWEELFKGETLRNACLTVADEVSLSPEALQSSFRFTKNLVLADMVGNVIPLHQGYLEFDEDKFNMGLDTLVVKRGKGITSDETKIVNEIAKGIQKGIDEHNERENCIDKSFEIYKKGIDTLRIDNPKKFRTDHKFPYDNRQEYGLAFKGITNHLQIKVKAKELVDELINRAKFNEL